MNTDASSWEHRPIADTATFVSIATLFATPYLMSLGVPGLPEELHYLLPDLLIFVILTLRFRGDAFHRAGLSIPARDGLWAASVFVLGFPLAGWLMGEISTSSGVHVSGHRPFFSLTQVFHQELVLRGLLLGTLASRISSRGALIVGGAIVFAGLHPLVVWWRWDGVLPMTTGLTLFSFALATNLLFVRAGHIGFALAVHAAWNLHRFGTGYRFVGEERAITEWESFAGIEGSTLAVIASVALLAAVLIADSIYPRQDHEAPSG